jgi:hypothetical protein
LRRIKYLRRASSFSGIFLDPDRRYAINFSDAGTTLRSANIATTPIDKTYVEISNWIPDSASDMCLSFWLLVEWGGQSANTLTEASGTRIAAIQSNERLPPEAPMGAKDSNGNLILGERLDPDGGTDFAYVIRSVEGGSSTALVTNDAERRFSQLEFFDFFQTLLFVTVEHTAVVPISILSVSFVVELYDLGS